MAEVPPLIPPNLRESVHAKSSRAAELATRISDAIQSVDNWLDSLPVKIAATSWEQSIPAGNQVLVLGYFRSHGRIWMLYHRVGRATGDGEYESSAEWAPLTKADIDTKLRAIALLPKLVETLDANLAARCAELEEANAGVDKIIANVAGKEGK